MVMIAVKDRKSVSFFKLVTFIPMDSTNDSLLFDPFIVSVFVEHFCGQKQWLLTFSLHCLYSMFIHLPLIRFAPPLRLLIDLANDLPIFAIAYYYAYYYAFLIVFLTWLAYFLSHEFTRFFIFCFSLTKGNVSRLYHPYRQYTDLFIFRFVSLLYVRRTLRSVLHYTLSYFLSSFSISWFCMPRFVSIFNFKTMAENLLLSRFQFVSLTWLLTLYRMIFQISILTRFEWIVLLQ